MYGQWPVSILHHERETISSKGGEFVNLRQLPDILQSAGVVLHPLTFWDGWGTKLVSEIGRRQALKRSSPSASLSNAAASSAASDMVGDYHPQTHPMSPLSPLNSQLTRGNSDLDSDDVGTTLFASDEGVHFDDDSQQQQEPSNQTGPTFNIKWPTRLADPPGSGQQVVHVTDQTERVGEQPVHGLRSDSDIMNMSKSDRNQYLQTLSKGDLVKLCAKQFIVRSSLQARLDKANRGRKVWSQSARRLKTQLGKKKHKSKN